MSLIEEYKELEKTIKEDAELRAKHYQSVNLPGTRTMGTDIDAAKKRVAEMKSKR